MGSERQSGGEHLLLQFAGAVDLQCLLEQRLYLTGFVPSISVSTFAV
jgi:hypothetical protein